MNLENKNILLTGACGGLGVELARQLHQAGANLILVGRNSKALERLKVLLNQYDGATSHCVNADISNIAGREALIDYCRLHHPDLDIVINNAGVIEFSLLADSDGKAYDSIIETNLTAPIHLIHQLLPLLKARKEAAIVNVGSAFGNIGFPGYSVYSASKFGLRGFTETLRRELFDDNFQVLYFAPRAIQTKMNSDLVREMNHELGSKSDRPEDVANQLVQALINGKTKQSFVGWPEKFFARLNSILPGIVDGALKKQLSTVKKYSESKNSN